MTKVELIYTVSTISQDVKRDFEPFKNQNIDRYNDAIATMDTLTRELINFINNEDTFIIIKDAEKMTLSDLINYYRLSRKPHTLTELQKVLLSMLQQK